MNPLEESKQSLFEWTLIFNNRQRCHSPLAYLSPGASEQQASQV
jgi:hypothetical protein